MLARLNPLKLSLLAIYLVAIAIGIAIHTVVWRIGRPKDDASALFKLVVLLPFLESGVAAFYLLDLRGLQLLDALVLSGIFHFGAGFLYMGLYTAAQAASPTSLILLRLAQSTSDGIEEAELCEAFTWQQLSGDSVQSAIDEGFLAVKGRGELALAPRGRALLRITSVTRRFLGLGSGKG